MMLPSEDPLEEHGGIQINNLNKILHIDEDTQEEEDNLEFNLTEYFHFLTNTPGRNTNKKDKNQ